MHLTPAKTYLGQRDQVVSYWKIGKPVTAGHWYHIFRAKPKSLGSDHPWDYVIKLVNPDLPPAKLQFALDRLGREAIARTNHALKRDSVVGCGIGPRSIFPSTAVDDGQVAGSLSG